MINDQEPEKFQNKNYHYDTALGPLTISTQ